MNAQSGFLVSGLLRDLLRNPNPPPPLDLHAAVALAEVVENFRSKHIASLLKILKIVVSR